MRRTLAPVVTVLLGLGTGCGHGSPPPTPATPVRIEVVATHAPEPAARYSATIRPVRQVELAFRLGGFARELLSVNGADGRPREVQEGDVVAAGAVLARLREADYDVKLREAQAQVREAEAAESQAASQLGEARAARTQAQAQVAEADAALQAARLDHERSSRLFASQSLTRPEYEAAQARFDSTRARIEAARAQVEAATARIAAAGAQIAAAEARKERARQGTREAELAVQDTALTVPFRAVVLKRSFEVGALVPPGAAAFVLADMSSVKAVFGVPDLVVEHLPLGSLPSLTVEAVPGAELRGRITRIAPSADPASRLFDVEVTVANPGAQLRVGMIATVAVAEREASRPLPAVPLAAIVRPPSDGKGYAVFVVETDSGRDVARVRRIEPGVALGNRVAVTSGLKVGDRVVVSGATPLVDGRPVRVVP